MIQPSLLDQSRTTDLMPLWAERAAHDKLIERWRQTSLLMKEDTDLVLDYIDLFVAGFINVSQLRAGMNGSLAKGPEEVPMFEELLWSAQNLHKKTLEEYNQAMAIKFIPYLGHSK